MSPEPGRVAGEKLQKLLARVGLGSRRELEQWIADGRVTVDGAVAKLGDRATPEQDIRVDGQPLAAGARDESARRIMLYNRPEGEVCTTPDPQGPATRPPGALFLVTDIITALPA